MSYANVSRRSLHGAGHPLMVARLAIYLRLFLVIGYAAGLRGSGSVEPAVQGRSRWKTNPSPAPG